MSDYIILRDDELYHYGVLGMKWGVRRYENPDGTLTAAGKRRYGTKRYQKKRGFHSIESQSNRYNDYSENVVRDYYNKKGYKNTKEALKDYKKRTGKSRNDWVNYNRKIADKQLKIDYQKEFGGLNEYNRDRYASKIASDSFYTYDKNMRNGLMMWGLVPNAAVGIADAVQLSKKHGPKGTNNFYKMMKADKQSKDYIPTGKYKKDTLDLARKSKSEINRDYKKIKEKEYYNSLNKNEKLDYNYKKNHKQLSRFINRDGSLTTQGKLKYWDSYAPRGEARKQRDIERDKRRRSK